MSLHRVIKRMSKKKGTPAKAKVPPVQAENRKEEENNADENEVNEEKSDRHWDRDQAKIKRMIDVNQEDRYEMGEVSEECLGNLKGRDPKVKKIIIRKEDVELIADQMETTRIHAESQLLKHDGDVRAAIKELMGF